MKRSVARKQEYIHGGLSKQLQTGTWYEILENYKMCDINNTTHIVYTNIKWYKKM